MPRASSISPKRLQGSLKEYLDHVRIETDNEPAPFTTVADDWQMADVESIRPAVESLVVRNAPKPTIRRFWQVRPRGHAKTSDAAVLVAWVLAFSPRRRRGIWVAADRDQGCEGLDSIATLCRHNPWLEKLLTIRADRILNERTGSVVMFTTSDVSSAYGWRDCDLFMLDEVTHWRTGASEELWTAIYSTAAKRRNSLVLALMNAGHSGTWQQRLRDQAESDDNWAFSELPDAVASWIDVDALRDQQRYLPQAAFDRLWRNRWSSSLGDALDPESIERSFDATLRPMTGKEKGWRFVTGVDLSLTRDFTAAITLAIPDGTLRQRSRITLADAKLWRPPKDGKLNLLEIQRYLLELDDRFGLEHICLDAWQAEHLASSLELTTHHRRRGQRQSRYRKEAWVKTIQPTTTFLRDSAHLTIESFVDDRLRFFDYEPLRRDFLNLRAEDRGALGLRLVSPRTRESGHGDSYSAFALALVVGHELSSKRKIVLKPMWGPGSEQRIDPLDRQQELEDEYREMQRAAYDKYDEFHSVGGFREAVVRAAQRKQQRPSTSRHAPPPGGFRGMPAPPSRSSDPSVGRSPSDVFGGGGGATGRSPRDLFGS